MVDVCCVFWSSNATRNNTQAVRNTQRYWGTFTRWNQMFHPFWSPFLTLFLELSISCSLRCQTSKSQCLGSAMNGQSIGIWPQGPEHGKAWKVILKAVTASLWVAIILLSYTFELRPKGKHCICSFFF
jgi:hypothetical protein